MKLDPAVVNAWILKSDVTGWTLQLWPRAGPTTTWIVVNGWFN